MKTYATAYCEELSWLYLLFLEYRRFAARIGKPLHLEYFPRNVQQEQDIVRIAFEANLLKIKIDSRGR